MNDSNSLWLPDFHSSFKFWGKKKRKTNDKVNSPLNYKVAKFTGQDLPCFLSR